MVTNKTLQNEGHTSDHGRVIGMWENVKAHGALGNGVADDTVAIQAAIAAVTTAGGGVVFFPPGRYKTTLAGRIFPTESPSDLQSQGVIAMVQSNTRITGTPDSVIYMTGVPTENYLGPNQADHYRVFGMDGVHDVEIDHLTFEGEYDIADGAFYAADAGFIRIGYTNPSSDIDVHDCTFKNLCGQAVAGMGSEAMNRVHVRNNYLYEMANGINCNSPYSLQTGNSFLRSAGIELGAKHGTISGNRFEDSRATCISVGGYTAADTVGIVRGMVVSNNAIHGSTDMGIVIADGVRGAVFSGNNITRCDEQAIGMTSSTGYPPSDCLFVGNQIYGNCKVGTGTIAVGLGQGGNHRFIGNVVFDEDSSADYWQRYCLDVYATGHYIEGNVLTTSNRGAASTAIVMENASSAYIGENIITADTDVTWNGTAAAVAHQPRIYPAPTDVFLQSNLTATPMFKVLADGTVSWAAQYGSLDTNLYRSAASVLKTDDKFHVALELEVDGALNHDGTTVGFYSTTPVAKQTGVTVDAAGIHAALVNLGLISA